VVSIEPGIYIPGFGGVRLENVVKIVKHSSHKGMLCFVPFTYIGYDNDLIDEALLTHEEKKWLLDYHKECEKRGNL